jgi:hypothetical protein
MEILLLFWGITELYVLYVRCVVKRTKWSNGCLSDDAKYTFGSTSAVNQKMPEFYHQHLTWVRFLAFGDKRVTASGCIQSPNGW